MVLKREVPPTTTPFSIIVGNCKNYAQSFYTLKSFMELHLQIIFYHPLHGFFHTRTVQTFISHVSCGGSDVRIVNWRQCNSCYNVPFNPDFVWYVIFHSFGTHPSTITLFDINVLICMLLIFVVLFIIAVTFSFLSEFGYYNLLHIHSHPSLLLAVGYAFAYVYGTSPSFARPNSVQ